jgi:RNA polymerase sigma-70 factor (ECF subfamily)
MKTDHDLIRQFQKGNYKAFDELVAKHLQKTFKFFLRITGNESEAEDLSQTIFLKMFKALKNFKFESEFQTYLYRANVNQANSYLRRNRWRNLLHLDEIPEPGVQDTDRENEWKRKELWDAIAVLPAQQRKIVTMRIAQEMPYKEIARILDISENTAKVNYHHAVQTLKKRLN